MRKEMRVALIACLVIVLSAINAAAQSKTEKIQFEPPKPSLEFMARFEVNLDAPVLELGQIESVGKRRIIPITGGKFTGPRLSGTILNNGADWQMVSADGLAHFGNAAFPRVWLVGAPFHCAYQGVRRTPSFDALGISALP